MAMLVWFITGSSRGFGLEIARLALERGDAVVASARDTGHVQAALPGFGDRLLAPVLDVANEDQARDAVAQAMQRYSRIDVLVNNAGRGLIGAAEEASDQEVRELFETNVFGLLTVTRAVLPIMRRQRSGRVLNISSVGGFTNYRAGADIYAATKFAVEGISEAMRAELEPLGIWVTIVEPGAFRTGFLDPRSLRMAERTIEDYADTAGRTREWALQEHRQQPGDPVKAAAAMIKIATVATPPLRLPLGPDSIAAIEEKLASVAAELDQWRELAQSTSYDHAVLA